MCLFSRNQRNSLIHKTLCNIVALTFILTSVIPPQTVSAQTLTQVSLNLPQPGHMLPVSAPFKPAVINGISIYPENPLKFDFIVSQGDSQLSTGELKGEGYKLIKYFLASLTVPQENQWVNLSPYEEGRIIPAGFDQTGMGRDLLAQDYILKQLTASLIYPEDELGQKFWNRVYEKAQKLYGTTQIPMNTFNKIWIVPENATIYENGNTALITQSHLKVMLEEDFIALAANMGKKEFGLDAKNTEDSKVVSGVSSEVVREVLIPEIEKEVNEGQNFANLRQIYNSMILATWYKMRLKESLLGQVYVDQNKVFGVNIEDKEAKQKIYSQYVEAFSKGVYNYIKEDYDSTTQQIIPRKYFSGGAMGVDPSILTIVQEIASDAATLSDPSTVIMTTNLADAGPDAAQLDKIETSRSFIDVQAEADQAMSGRFTLPTPFNGISLAIDRAGISSDSTGLKESATVRYIQRIDASLEEIIQSLLGKSEEEQVEELTSRRKWIEYHWGIIKEIHGENKDLIHFLEKLRLSGYDNDEYLSPFPAEMLVAVAHIEYFRKEKMDRLIQTLVNNPEIQQYEKVSYDKLHGDVEAAIDELLEGLTIYPSVEYAVRVELRKRFHMAILHSEKVRAKLTRRHFGVHLTDSRDYHQSNFSTGLTGEDQRGIIHALVNLGIPVHGLETWGGNVPMAALMDSKHREKVEDPFFNLRQQMFLLRDNLRSAVKADGNIKEGTEAWDRLFDRYEVKEDRYILTEQELGKLLTDAGVDLRSFKGKEIKRIYQIRQEMLFRGPYFITLDKLPPETVKQAVRLSYKNGVDIFRVFIADNDVREINAVTGYVKELGYGQVQPVIHFTNNFPGGNERIVELAASLYQATQSEGAHEFLDTIVIKDAPGILKPKDIYGLVKAFREKFPALPLQIHTHDTVGQGGLVYLEAVRANGSDGPIIVDVSLGPEPFGQPRFRSFYRLIDGIPWQGDLKTTGSQLKEAEGIVSRIIHQQKYSSMVDVPLEVKLLMDEAGLPGGMYSNFIVANIFPDFKKYKSLFEDRYGFNVMDEKTGDLTEKGLQLRKAFVVLILEQMVNVTRHLGWLSRVTPYSQWIGRQAHRVVMDWIRADWLKVEYEYDGNNMRLVFNENFPTDTSEVQQMYLPKGRKGLAAAPKGGLNLEIYIKNMILTWAQDGFLRYLNPDIDPELVFEVFVDAFKRNYASEEEAREGLSYLRDIIAELGSTEDTNPDNDQIHPGIVELFRPYQAMAGENGLQMRTIGEVPIVNLRIMYYYDKYREIFSVDPSNSDNINREKLLSIGRNDPAYSIALTPGEFAQKADELHEQFPDVIEPGEEDVLMAYIFGRFAYNLFVQRGRWMGQLLGESDVEQRREAALALRNQGVDLNRVSQKLIAQREEISGGTQAAELLKEVLLLDKFAESADGKAKAEVALDLAMTSETGVSVLEESVHAEKYVKVGRDFFDRPLGSSAQAYGDHFNNAIWNRTNMRYDVSDELLEKVGRSGDKTVVDVSTGTGAATWDLLRRLRAKGMKIKKLVMIDVNMGLANSFLQYAFERIPEEFSDVVDEFEFYVLNEDKERGSWHFHDPSVIPGLKADLVLMENAIHVVPDVSRRSHLLQGIVRIINPGGDFVIGSGGIRIGKGLPAHRVFIDQMFEEARSELKDLFREEDFTVLKELEGSLTSSQVVAVDGILDSFFPPTPPTRDELAGVFRELGLNPSFGHQATPLTRTGFEGFILSVPTYARSGITPEEGLLLREQLKDASAQEKKRITNLYERARAEGYRRAWRRMQDKEGKLYLDWRNIHVAVPLNGTAASVADAALGAREENVGGINLDADLLDLQIKRDGRGVPLPVNLQPMEQMNIQGFLPIIIDIKPVNLPLMLGLSDQPLEQPAPSDGRQLLGKRAAVVEEYALLMNPN